MRIKVNSPASSLSVVLSTILTLSAICSGIGIAKADSVIATVGVGLNPRAIAFDPANGDLYVTVTPITGGAISVISSQRNQVIANIPVGGVLPFGITFDSANGNLYVTNQGDRTVSVISGQTSTVIGSPIPVGSFPKGIAFDSSNSNLYVTNEGDKTVSVISGR